MGGVQRNRHRLAAAAGAHLSEGLLDIEFGAPAQMSCALERPVGRAFDRDHTIDRDAYFFSPQDLALALGPGENGQVEALPKIGKRRNRVELVLAEGASAIEQLGDAGDAPSQV